MNSGIYQIVLPSGRKYIGSAKNFAARWRVHKSRLIAGNHHNRLLQAAWRKYGDALKFERLIICAVADLLFYEQRAIDVIGPELNVLRVAGNSIGYRHTKETKAKFPFRRKGSVSEQGKLARKEGIARWRMSDKHREAISQCKSRAVTCVDTGRRFPSSTKAAAWVKASINPKAKSTNIGWAADGKSATAYGLKWAR